MAFTPSYIIAALLLSFFGVSIADGCYSNGIKLGQIVGGDIDDPIKDFCLDHHGATFTEAGQAKGCVDTNKRKNTASLNITIEFTSIPDESKAVNFTIDACKDVLMSVAKKCQHGGEGITVSFPTAVSPTMKARDKGHSNLDQRDPMEIIQGRDASVPPITTDVSFILQNSTTSTNQPAGAPETSLFFNSTAKCNDTMKTNTAVPETVKITTTLPITLTISVAPDAGSTSTVTTTTTSTTISTTAKRTTTTTITPTTTSNEFSSQSSSSVTAMNVYFTAKIKMDPNDCGCAHC